VSFLALFGMAPRFTKLLAPPGGLNTVPDPDPSVDPYPVPDPAAVPESRRPTIFSCVLQYIYHGLTHWVENSNHIGVQIRIINIRCHFFA
jgi:hypothetical protein